MIIHYFAFHFGLSSRKLRLLRSIYHNNISQLYCFAVDVQGKDIYVFIRSAQCIHEILVYLCVWLGSFTSTKAFSFGAYSLTSARTCITISRHNFTLTPTHPVLPYSMNLLETPTCMRMSLCFSVSIIFNTIVNSDSENDRIQWRIKRQLHARPICVALNVVI